MISAVILAAGRSLRMGRPKMILPWGETTVIGQVLRVLEQAGLEEIVAVTGGHRLEVERALRGSAARPVFNPDYADGEMARSLQVGLAALSPRSEAALIVLGDQPQIDLAVVQAVLVAYRHNLAALVVPSFEQRRGHPWLVARSFWDDLFQIAPPVTLRDFLNQNLTVTHFIDWPNRSVLLDLDTPEDYQRHRPDSVGSE